MALVYGKALETIDVIQPRKPIKKEKQLTWWEQLLISLGTTVVFSIIAPFVGSLFAPALAPLAEGIFIAGGTVAVDEATGQNDPLTIGLDLAFSFLPVISKTARSLKTAYNPINQIAERVEDTALRNELKELSIRLEKAQFSGVKPSEIAKEYKNVLREFDEITMRAGGYLPTEIKATGKEAIEQAQLKTSKLKNMNHALRKINKIMSLTDPGYVSKKITMQVTKPIKAKINKLIGTKLSRYSEYASKGFSNTRKALNKSLLPLNHTGPEWITGIRLISVVNFPGYFHVEVQFDRFITRSSANPQGKPPVMLYNKNFNSEILPWLEDSSGGSFYLNNISWGREIGKFMRDNSLFLGMSYVPYVQQYISTFMAFRRIAYHIQKISNLNYWEHISKNIVGELITGFEEGMVTGLKIPGMKLTKAIVKSYNSKSAQYVYRYANNSFKKVYKRRRNLKYYHKALSYQK